MQRLVLFDLDDTPINLGEVFQAWAGEFASEHGLGHEAVDRLVALDRVGHPYHEVFFGQVLSASLSPRRLRSCGAATAGACHTSFTVGQG